MRKRATISATYSDGCFCKRPVLGELANIEIEPRFEFAKAARQWCQFNKAVFGGINTGGTERSAWAEILQPCSHRERQRVRISWNLSYD